MGLHLPRRIGSWEVVGDAWVGGWLLEEKGLRSRCTVPQTCPNRASWCSLWSGRAGDYRYLVEDSQRMQATAGVSAAETAQGHLVFGFWDVAVDRIVVQ